MTEAPYGGTSIADPPSLTGRVGRAWRLRLRPVGQRSTIDADGTVSGFIVQAPNRHPFWDHWMMSVVHLRKIPGGTTATILLAGATHEIMIVALSPEHPLPSLDVDGRWQPQWLQPIDVLEQFVARNDAAADAVLEWAAQTIIDGGASPDQDWRRWWHAEIPRIAQRRSTGRERPS